MKFSAAALLRIAGLVVLLSGCRTLESSGFPAAQDRRTPRLVVVLVVDGLGQHQLSKFRDRLGEGGFRRFLDAGAWFPNANYGHSTTVTAVGHATIVTGAYPYRHGMVSNDWFDRATKKIVFCTEDPDIVYLGEATKEHQGTSPRNLQVTTLGDELRVATGFRSRVASVALKSYPSILMGGRLGSSWFYSASSGRFITSNYYRKKYPDWWSDFHSSNPQNRWFGAEWAPLAPEAAYEGAPEARPFIANYKGLGKGFPHKVDGGKPKIGADYYAAMEGTPFGHEYLSQFSKELITREGLGRNPAGVPDIFAVSFSSHDFINHNFGPESKESEDDFLRLDRTIADFLQFLDGWVGAGNSLIVLTADHGFSPTPEYWRDTLRLEASRINPKEMLKALNDHLGQKFGMGVFATAWRLPTVWLDYDLIDQRRLARTEVEREAASFLSGLDGIHSVFTRTQLSQGLVPPTRLGLLVSRSWNSRVSGDLLLIQKDGWYFSEAPSTMSAMHGSPWSYDTRVPLAFLGANWVKAGRYGPAAEPADIAPTLACVLDVPPPSGCEGRILSEILR